MRYLLILVLLTGTALAAPARAGIAPGFWDPGFVLGGWRSDFSHPDVGTSARPLDYDVVCAFPDVMFAICPTHLRPLPGVAGGPARVFARSNWTQQPGWLRDRFWVVSANVEPALDPNCNSGPPNQSEAVGRPFETVFGIAIAPAAEGGPSYRNEAVLAVDLSHRPRQLAARPACRPLDFIPYLGLALQRGRGSAPIALTTLTRGGMSPVLRFDLRLIDTNAELFAEGESVPPRPRGQYAGLLVEAEWDGRKRAVWIDLINAFALPSPAVAGPWNWALRDSFYYPGIDFVFTSGPTLRAQCGAEGFGLPSTAPAAFAHRQPVPVRLDLARLFACVGAQFSSPYAQQTAPVPITGVQFFVEVGVRDRDGLPGLSATDYDSRFGLGVSGVEIVPAYGTPMSSDPDYIAQLGPDLAGRAWTAAETAHWQQHARSHGAAPMVAAMLQHAQVRRSLVAAARMNLIAFDQSLSLEAFATTLATLRSGAAPAVAAQALAATAALSGATRGLDDEAFVRRLFRHALGGEVDTQPDAAALADAYGSIGEWSDALRSGRRQRHEVLLAAFRLAEARGLREREAQIAAIYHTYLGLLPSPGGFAAWRTAAHMPEQLIDLLYFSDDWRRRFDP